jgi:hypothetical protein
MSKPSQKTLHIRSLLAARGMTFDDLVRVTGRARKTLVNVINDCGSSALRPTQKIISDVLQAQIFDGVVPAPRTIEFKLPPGTQIVLPNPDAADALGAALQKSVSSRDGNSLTTGAELFIHVPAPLGPREPTATDSSSTGIRKMIPPEIRTK